MGFTDRHCLQQQGGQGEQRVQQGTAVVRTQAAHSTVTTLQLMRLLSAWANSILLVLLKTMTKLLDRAQADAAADVTGAGAEPLAGGSSNGDSSSGSSGSSRSVLQPVLATIEKCMQLLSAMDVVASVQQTDSGPEHGDAVQRFKFFLPSAWPDHATEVVAALEGYVRLLLSLGGTEHSALVLDYSTKLIHTLSLLLRRGTQLGAPGVFFLLTLPVFEHLASTLLMRDAPARNEKQGSYSRGLMSLLVSALKLAGSSGMRTTHAGMHCLLFTTDRCVVLLEKCMDLLSELDCVGGSDVSARGPAAGGSSSAGGSVPGPAAAYTACLPWLLLLGRCCY